MTAKSTVCSLTHSRFVVCAGTAGVLSLLMFAAVPACRAQQAEPGPRTLSERVTAVPIPEGAPKPSDVCFRSLVRRVAKPDDSRDTIEAMKVFHATRLEWTYGIDAAYVRDVHALGCTIQGAAANSSVVVDRSDSGWKNRVGCVDLNGDYVIAPWMRTWPSKPIYYCVNNPEAREGALAYFKKLIDTGVDSIQQDATHLNHSATSWGACFCDHCMAGFNTWLTENTTEEERRSEGIADLTTFDYREHLKALDAPVGDAFRRWPDGGRLRAWFVQFQLDSTTAYHRWWRRRLNEWAGRRVPASCNNGTHRFEAPEGVFDYFHGELPERFANPAFLWHAFQKAHAMGKTQTVMMPQRQTFSQSESWTRHTRQTIATAYALGGHCRVPWDQYMPRPDAKRYFGTPEQYADLYAFVRGCDPCLDGYAEAAVRGLDLEDSRWEGEIAPVLVDDPGVYAFVRAKPGMPDAPVAVHLVDWSSRPERFRLQIAPAVFFRNRPLRLRLLTPAPYNQGAHTRAWETKDYTPLVATSDLGRGYITQVDVPPLVPWGIVLVEPVDDAPPVPWPPLLDADPLRFVERTTVRMGSPDARAALHYTLDGSAPTLDSARYANPFDVTETLTVRAVSVVDGVLSDVSALRLVKREPDPDLVRNGDFEAGLAHWTPVVWPNPAGDEAMNATVDTTGRLSGPNSVRLDVPHPDGVAHHMRIYQTVQLRESATYTVRFRAVASQPARIRANLQERDVPNRVVTIEIIQLGTEPADYVLQGFNRFNRTDETGRSVQVAGLHFDLGLVPPGTTVWIDDVAVHESLSEE